MKIYLNPTGKGAFRNTKFSKQEVRESFDYVISLDKINKSKRENRDKIVIDVPRDKCFWIRELLKEKRYDVKIKDIFES